MTLTTIIAALDELDTDALLNLEAQVQDRLRLRRVEAAIMQARAANLPLPGPEKPFESEKFKAAIEAIRTSFTEEEWADLDALWNEKAAISNGHSNPAQR